MAYLQADEKLLVLCRHAQSALNATRKEYLFQPWTLVTQGISRYIDPGVLDAPLTASGQAQARAAGAVLAEDIARGRLPRIDMVGVSPLRRTLHTTRLIVDAADEISKSTAWWKSADEVRRNTESGNSLFLKNSTSDPSSPQSEPYRTFSVQCFKRSVSSRSDPALESEAAPPAMVRCRKTSASIVELASQPVSTPTTAGEEEEEDDISVGKRILIIVPYLRERRTTSADQPMVRPAQALEYWRDRGVDAQVADREDQGGGGGFYLRPGTRQTLNHYLTVGLTKQCRKVDIESVESVNRRVGLLEDWVHSCPYKVMLIVGHNMIFRAWQQHWKANDSPVRWAPREEIIAKMGEGSLAETLEAAGINKQRHIYECGNAEFLIVRWRSGRAAQDEDEASRTAWMHKLHRKNRRREDF